MITFYDVNKILTNPIIFNTQKTNKNSNILSFLIYFSYSDSNTKNIILNNYKIEDRDFIDSFFDHLEYYPKEILNNFFKCVNYNNNNSINIGIPIESIDINNNSIIPIENYKFYISFNNSISQRLIKYFNMFLNQTYVYDNSNSLGGNYNILNNENLIINPDYIRYDSKNNYLYYVDYEGIKSGKGLFDYLDPSNIQVYNYSPYSSNSFYNSRISTPFGHQYGTYSNRFIENYKQYLPFYNIIVDSFFNKLNIVGNGFHINCDNETMTYFYNKLEDFIVNKQLINLENGLRIERSFSF